MQVHVRFFATLKDRAGVERCEIELPDGSSVSQLISVLASQYPDLVAALPSALVAVNHEYAFGDSPLKHADEIALFPPVSGGAIEATWPEHFAITNDELDLNALVAAITLPETGAVAVFSGAVRGKTSK